MCDMPRASWTNEGSRGYVALESAPASSAKPEHLDIHRASSLFEPSLSLSLSAPLLLPSVYEQQAVSNTEGTGPAREVPSSVVERKKICLWHCGSKLDLPLIQRS